jgi:hypothetical protein
MKESPFPKFRKFEDLEDPFNPQNKISGYISVHESNMQYGALWIDSVNGKPTGQLLYMTPKLHYPFGKMDDDQRRYHFPKFEKIEVFEKYDGTNIVAFKYLDAEGKNFISYKTRGSPFLRNNNFNNFLDMWNETLKIYSDIPKLAEPFQSLSFELFGSRNRILVNYKVSLEVKLLFLIDPENGNISPPTSLVISENLKFPKIAKLHASFDPETDIPKKYEEMQAEIQSDLEKKNKLIQGTPLEIRTHLLSTGMNGAEGSVWFVKLPSKENNWNMFKCKPDLVEQIHWNAGNISSVGIYTTCINAMEQIDELTYEAILPYLLEEYPLEDIEKRKATIDKVIKEINVEIQFKDEVMIKFDEIYERTQSTEKRIIMRELSSFFAKSKMSKVFAVLAKEGIFK